MDKLTKKTFTTSRTYTYYQYQPPALTTKPTLLLCHGWPDSAELFSGYAGTSKPIDYKKYSHKAMAHDLFGLFESESIGKIIPLGHDWGSALAQQVYLYRPEKCSGLVVLSLAYISPSDQPFDLNAFNKMIEQAFGYPCSA